MAAVNVVTGPMGEMTEASYQSDTTSIQVVVKKEHTAIGIRASLIFTEDGVPIFESTAELVRDPGDSSRVQNRLTLKGQAIDRKLVLDVTSIVTYMIPHPTTATLEVVDGRQSRQATFDFDAWSPKDLAEAPWAATTLPNELETKLQPLLPSLNSLVEHYKNISDGAFSVDRGHPPRIMIPIPRAGSSEALRISWGSICRAACWGAAGGAAAACCAGTAGAACIACAGAEGALASLCSDSCPP